MVVSTKRDGCGPGLPTAWQGWPVPAACVAAAALAFPPHDRPVTFCAYVIVATLPWFVVCRPKGEPPAWRRGARG